MERRRRVNQPNFPDSEDSENERVSALRRQVAEVVSDEPNFDVVLEKTGLEARCLSSEMYKFIYGLRLVGREVVLLRRYLQTVEEIPKKAALPPPPEAAAMPNTDNLKTPTVYVGGNAAAPKEDNDAFNSPPSHHLPFGGGDEEGGSFSVEGYRPQQSSSSDSPFQSLLPTPLD